MTPAARALASDYARSRSDASEPSLDELLDALEAADRATWRTRLASLLEEGVSWLACKALDVTTRIRGER